MTWAESPQPTLYGAYLPSPPLPHLPDQEGIGRGEPCSERANAGSRLKERAGGRWKVSRMEVKAADLKKGLAGGDA